MEMNPDYAGFICPKYMEVSELVGFLTCDVIADHIIKETLKFGTAVHLVAMLDNALAQQFSRVPPELGRV